MTIVSDTTLVPGTTYYFPSGLAANEESWLNNGAFKEAPSLFSYGLDCDSVTGYDSGCVVTITAIFGYESETDSTEFLYGDDNVAAGWIVWSDSVQTLCRTDKGRLINCGLPLHERRRYTITVTDTVHIDSFRETPAKP
ncbi:MAG: hypothetical protein KDB65_10635 [Calditrichaeota bacterium]|nr:hypothetical protein [Calditrichota bacterium]